MNSRICLALIAAALAAGCDAEDDARRVVGELASDRVELSAEFAEPIVEILVREGETVAAGQLLLRLDDARASVRVDEARARVAETEARLAELVRGPRSELLSAARAEVTGAETELEFRDAELRRIRDVHARGLTSADTLDRARAARDAAASTLDQRRARLEELLAGTTVEELRQAEAAVAAAAAALEAVEIDLARHALTAPVAGVIDSRLLEAGERPQPGQPVLVLLTGEQPYARVYVPEALRVTVAPGARATIYVDGLDAALDGRVRWVASEAAFTPYFALTERDRGRLAFLAKVDIVEDRARLPDGVPVEVVLAGDAAEP